MTTAQERFYGSADEIDITSVPGNYQLAPGSPKVLTIGSITGDEGRLMMPDATKLRLGGTHFYVINNHATKNVFVIDTDEADLGAPLMPGLGGKFSLLKNDDAAGEWLQMNLTDVRLV